MSALCILFFVIFLNPLNWLMEKQGGCDSPAFYLLLNGFATNLGHPTADKQDSNNTRQDS